MIILSNGFPTNMPNSEEVSQGGPANFARLFSNHIASVTPHKWIGIIFRGHDSKKIRINKVLSVPQRDYFRIYFPKRIFKKITQAKKNSDPAQILKVMINRTALLICKQKPDVVFLNGFGLFNWVLLKASEQAGIPVVIQHAGIWTKELRLHKHLYSSAGIKIMEKMERDSTYLTTAEVFLNTWSRDYYQKHVARRHDENNIIIPLPFDFKYFANNAKKQCKSVFTDSESLFKIGTVARWDGIKNHKALLSLAKMAKQASLPWKFYAVTKIVESNSMAKNYGKNILTIPSLNRIGISDFCQSMDILILPSLFDVSPTVVLEAISTNTPILISDNIGYVHEFEKHGAKEWIDSFDNTRKTLNKIKNIARKPMPESLQKQITINHDYKKVFFSYLDLFQRISMANKPLPIKNQRTFVPDMVSA